MDEMQNNKSYVSIANLNEGNSSNKDSILFSMLNVGVTKDNEI